MNNNRGLKDWGTNCFAVFYPLPLSVSSRKRKFIANKLKGVFALIAILVLSISSDIRPINTIYTYH